MAESMAVSSMREVSGYDYIAFLAENVYRDVIVKHVKCGPFLSEIPFPEESQGEREEIVLLDRQERHRAAMGKLLDHFKSSTQKEDYALFLQLLELNGYVYVVKLLRGEHTRPLDEHEEHVRVMQFFSEDIAKKVDPKRIRQRLRQEGWIECLKEEGDMSEGKSETPMEDDTITENQLIYTGDSYREDNNFDQPPAQPALTYDNSHTFTHVYSWLKNIEHSDNRSFTSEEDNIRNYGEDYPVTDALVRTRERVIKRLENRPYQDELARAAIDGGNVIIIAPTGCGKTVVALNIIQNHLSHRETSGMKSKVVFFANEITLVDQQYELCRGHLSHKVMMVVGETKYKTKESLIDMIDKNDVLVMTPQIVVDALESGSLKSMSIFSLVIFDECHHVRDRHPTNQIMAHFMEEKHGGNSNHLPQVVGLTASVGVGKKKDKAEKEGATEHILQLCANLDATGGLATVRENKDSLAQYANQVSTAIRMAGKRESEVFKSRIVEMMENIEEKIIQKQMDSEGQLKHIKSIEREVRPCQEKGTSWYTQWLGKLHSDKFLRVKHDHLRRYFITCLQYLKEFNKTLNIYSDCRAYDAMRYLEDKVKILCPTEPYRTDIDKWLLELYKENLAYLQSVSGLDSNSNPKLALLESLVLEQIRLDGSRVLILVKTRDLAHALCDWMMSDPKLQHLNPVVVTGCGASKEEGGMTRTQQLEAVKSFKWGRSLVALATSVAEEGMDVSTCSRVIRYEYVSNEIGMIQARGRASRVKDGSYYTVTSSEEVKGREEVNIRLEAVMEEAVAQLQIEAYTNRIQFRGIIESIQKGDRRSRFEEKQKLLEQPLTEDTYTLKCYQCGAFAVLSSDIRVVAKSHRLVISEDIMERVNEQKPAKQEAFDSMQKVSAVHCKRCASRWGSGVIHKDKKYVCLSVVNFMCYDMGNYGYRFPKWKVVRFKCKPMEDEEGSAMSTSQ